MSCLVPAYAPIFPRYVSAPYTHHFRHRYAFHDVLFLRKRLKDHDPSAEPIVVLACGHAYTLTTLDGVMDLASAYVKVGLRFPCLSPASFYT